MRGRSPATPLPAAVRERQRRKESSKSNRPFASARVPKAALSFLGAVVLLIVHRIAATMLCFFRCDSDPPDRQHHQQPLNIVAETPSTTAAMVQRRLKTSTGRLAGDRMSSGGPQLHVGEPQKDALCAIEEEDMAQLVEHAKRRAATMASRHSACGTACPPSRAPSGSCSTGCRSTETATRDAATRDAEVAASWELDEEDKGLDFCTDAYYSAKDASHRERGKHSRSTRQVEQRTYRMDKRCRQRLGERV